MEQQIRAVLFDMDGLMFDTERLGDEVWRAVAGKYGVTMTPEDVSLLRGRNYESGRCKYSCRMRKPERKA
ncbi:HAD hydrolase-like protein [Ruthenibacterium lactatiformans]|uniref:HAD hydrolase-like protein n=1 Tax=Ruthenibacterium lactatiformans TaxID=1550024 RepID=UPI0032C05999